MRSIVVLAAATLVSALGQSFEVTSIKPVDAPNRPAPKAANVPCTIPEALIDRHRVTLRTNLCGLIRLAYNVQSQQISGSASELLTTEALNFYDIAAQVAEGRTLTVEQTRPMFQSLLAERFDLKLRRESEERPVFLLTVHRDGIKMSTQPMRDCVNGRPPAKGLQGGVAFGGCEATYTIAQLVEHLLRTVDRPIIDRTGLTGAYSLYLRYTRQPVARADAPPELPAALQEQLGLRLEAARAPVEVLVIEAVHRPSEN